MCVCVCVCVCVSSHEMVRNGGAANGKYGAIFDASSIFKSVSGIVTRGAKAKERERERERNGSGHIHHLSSCKLFDADHDIVLSIKCKTKPSKKRCINKIDYDFMFIVFVIEKRRKRGGSGCDGAGNSTRFPETL